jgi:simple sugar transport system permease protein
MLAFKKNPIEAYKEMFSWPFGNRMGFIEAMLKAIPLMFTGLGVSIAFRSKLWNIGAEGQLYVGAVATTWAVLYLFPANINPLLGIPMFILIGSIAGAIWGMIPGLLKAYFETNEIVSTLMLNYIAILLADYLVYGPWKDPHGYNFPLSAMFPKSSFLPTMFGTRIHTGLIIAIISAFFIYYLFNWTKWGFRTKLLGDSLKTAEYTGMDVKRYTVSVMLVSGLFAGMAGAVQMLGVQHRLMHGISPGYGYTAIIVAWLSKLNPFVILLVSLLFGGMLVGNEQLELFMQIPSSFISILQGTILFSIMAGELFLKYKITFGKKG